MTRCQVVVRVAEAVQRGRLRAAVAGLPVLAKLACTERLNRTGRDQLAGLQYALRIADR